MFLHKISHLRSVNYYQLFMKFAKVLILAEQEILKGFSSIFQMLLLRFDMKVYFFEITKKLLNSASTKRSFKRTRFIVTKCSIQCS